MRMVHQHPDGTIWIRTDDGHIGGTPEEIRADTGEELPPLPEGITERIYEPDKRHALIDDCNVVDGGPMPWPEGDAILAAFPAAMAKRQAREQAVRDEWERMRQQSLAEVEEFKTAVAAATSDDERREIARRFNERVKQ